MSRLKHKTQQWIDSETADRITILNLKDYREYLKKEFKEWKESPKSDSNPNGNWYLPRDAVLMMQTITALDLIISHFIETEDKIENEQTN